MKVIKSIGLLAAAAPLALVANPAFAQVAAGSAPAPADPVATTAQATTAQAAAAGEAPQADLSTEDVQDIVVTGVRQSLRAAIDTKRSADVISDSISSEDVGKFPTRNIADALQRITGVQVNRNFGEGSTILLRGLPSTMVTNMYNGRQLPSPTGGRSLDYSILPVDFVRTLSIYKTPTADLTQMGLAGTVNIEPVSPLDLKKRVFSFNIDGVHDGNSKRIRGGGSLFYADQFFNDTVGVALGVSKSVRAISRNGWSDYFFEPRREIPPGGAAVAGGNDFYPNGLDPNQNGVFTDTYRLWHYAQLQEIYGERDRTSGVLNLQWRPSPKFEVTGDVILSRMKTLQLNIGSNVRFTNALGAFSNVTADSANNIISADVDNTWIIATASSREPRDELFSSSLGFKWRPTDRLQIDAGGSFGKAKQENSNFTLEGNTYKKMNYNFIQDPKVVSWSYLDPSFDPLDPNSWYFDHINGTYKASVNNDTHEAHVNLKFETDLGPLKSVYAGGNILSNEFYGDGQNIYVSDLQALSDLTGLPIIPNAYPDGRSAISAASFMSLSPIKGNPLSTYKGKATFPKSFLWSDPRKFSAKYTLEQLIAIPGSLQRNAAVASRVDETVNAGYIRFNFADDDQRWSGNVGLRYERTTGDSRFYGVDFDQIVYDPRPSCDQVCAQSNQTLNATLLKTQKSTYGQWLPSLNAQYSITEKLLARFGASKQMTRPDLNVLIGGETVGMLQTPATGGNPITTISSGNPDIKPYLANAFDASLEWYFSREGLLSAAFFYKDVSNWVFTSQVDEVRTIKLATGGTRDYTFLRTLPQNGGGVKIKGLELSYQQPFTFLPGVLSGFGFTGNYTFVDASDIINKATNERTPVTGVSKHSFNASGYYEKYGFNARLSYNYRQGRIEAVRDYWNVTPVYSKSYGQFDLSVGYEVNRYAQLTLSVINLLNKPNYVAYAEQGGFINDWNQEGRITQLGLHITL